MTEEEYREMMVERRPLGRGQPLIGEDGNAQAHRQPEGSGQPAADADMARITASVYTCHVPAIGAAMDLGKTEEPYWQPVFDGYESRRRWIEEHKPDVVFLVYNDHATAFSLDMIPTFAIGTGAEFQPADEGWGPRPGADGRSAIPSSPRTSRRS